MRVIFTISFLLYSITMMSQLTVDSSEEAERSQKASADVKIALRCLVTPTVADEPLLVIDGIPVEYKNLNDLVPADIESISVLRDSNAAGICRALNGVIIVTTKKARYRTFVIRDLLDGSFLAGATVSFISRSDKKDTLMFVSNDSGLVTTDKISPGTEYDLAISSTGYKTFTATYKNLNTTNSSYSLDRDVISYSPVIVTAGVSHRRCWIGCRVQTVSVCKFLAAHYAAGKNYIFKVYPNPVQAGRNLTIEVDAQQDGIFFTNVLANDGRQLLSRSQKAYRGKNLFTININNGWPAGVYFIQVIDEKRNVLKIEKIVLVIN